MSNIVYKFPLAGDKFMPEIHLKQEGLTSLVVHSRGTKKVFKNLFKQQTRCNYGNNLHKTCFQHNMTQGS